MAMANCSVFYKEGIKKAGNRFYCKPMMTLSQTAQPMKSLSGGVF
jgi:hypothetical protein